MRVRLNRCGCRVGVAQERRSAFAVPLAHWTAPYMVLFSLIHNPCSTTIYTIHKETSNARWTTLAALIPLALGFVVTFLVAQVWRLFAGG